MARKRKWTNEDLKAALKTSTSIRQVLKKLGLVEAGGNYQQVQFVINDLKLDTSKLKGKGWRKDLKFAFSPKVKTIDILKKNSRFQSYKLKLRLFRDGFKKPQCELCGWAECSQDGRIPVELDHVNGDRFDNRLKNLRVLCPNCHSLQATHRGKNQKRRGGGIGRHATLKML